MATFSAIMHTLVETPYFSHWLQNLQDPITRARLLKRLRRATCGNLGDVAPVGEGVFEMREFFGPGWRMYYVQRDATLILMLGGGTKARQKRDIARAIALARQL